MEKTIKFIMNADKSIKITVNNEEKHTIDPQNRNINAENIYKIINFFVDDNYIIHSENPGNVDDKVLSFFVDLFKEIAEKLNQLTIQNTEEDQAVKVSLDDNELNF